MYTTIFVALITGVFASIPPLVKSYQDLKLKKVEIYEKQKIQIIIDFSEAVSHIYSVDGNLSGGEIAEYQHAVNKLLLYFPDIDTNVIDELNTAIHNRDLNKKQRIIRPLIIKLSKSLSEK